MQYPLIAIKLSSTEIGEQNDDYKNIFTRKMRDLNVEVKKGSSIQIKKPVRRVILGTPVAETGLTFEDLKYVIDTGFRKVNEYNPTLGIDHQACN